MKIAIAKPTKVPDSSPTESASFQVKTYNPIIPRGKQISELDDHQKDTQSTKTGQKTNDLEIN